MNEENPKTEPEAKAAQGAVIDGGAEAPAGGAAQPQPKQQKPTTRDISAAFENAVGGADGGEKAERGGGGGAEARQAHSESVYNGRLGAAMRENNELKRRLADLERRNAELEARAGSAGGGGGSGAGVEGVDDGDEGVFDEATRKGIAKLIERRTRGYEERIGQMDAELREYRAGATRRAFAETQAKSADRVERRYPGLLHDIAGSLRETWRGFCQTPDPITGMTFGQALHDATTRGAEDAAVRVFSEFVEAEGLGGRYAGGAGKFEAPPSRSPNPVTTVSSGRAEGGGDGQVWPSRDAILEAMDKIQRDERRGTIDRAERIRQLARLDDDLRSGRFLH